MRVKRGYTRRNKRKQILARTKGFRMTKRKLFKVAHEADLHAGHYAYVGRRLRKRDMRTLWITRIKGALTDYDLSYSKFTNGLKKADITINRKILTDLITSDPATFGKIVEAVKQPKIAS